MASAHGSRLVEAMLTSSRDEFKGLLGSYFVPVGQGAFIHAVHRAVAAASREAESRAAWSTFVAFWRALDSVFELRVATLNYDTLIDQALGLGGEAQGFEPIPNETAWRFNERILMSAPRLMHLHGSVQFGDREMDNKYSYEDEWEDVYWYPDAESALVSRGARSSHQDQAGHASKKGALITGLNKPGKLLGEPYGAYMRAFARSIVDSPRLLVVGYGHGDLHVNAVIRKMTKLHGPDRRVAAVGFFDPDQRRNGWEDWNEEHTAVAMWSERPRVFDDHEFSNPWRSPNGLVQVFYKGMMDVAREHVDSVVRFFSPQSSGQSDSATVTHS